MLGPRCTKRQQRATTAAAAIPVIAAATVHPRRVVAATTTIIIIPATAAGQPAVGVAIAIRRSPSATCSRARRFTNCLVKRLKKKECKRMFFGCFLVFFLVAMPLLCCFICLLFYFLLTQVGV